MVMMILGVYTLLFFNSVTATGFMTQVKQPSLSAKSELGIANARLELPPSKTAYYSDTVKFSYNSKIATLSPARG